MAKGKLETKPWQHPIVAEVREVREALFAAAGHDVHEFCRGLREREAASGHRVIQAPEQTPAQPARRA